MPQPILSPPVSVRTSDVELTINVDLTANVGLTANV